jgi:hypothetical protein
MVLKGGFEEKTCKDKEEQYMSVQSALHVVYPACTQKTLATAK